MTSKMLEEIRQQPVALERTLRGELRKFEKLKKTFEKKKPRFIALAARGTSDNAAQFARYLLEITTGIPVSLCAPSVYTLYKAPVDLRDSLVVAISQSGESTDTNVVLETARAAGAITVGITNEADSAMSRLAEHTFLVRAGREKSVAATKTYTGQMMALYLLAWSLGARISLDELRRIPEWTDAALKLQPRVAEAAVRFRFMDHAVVIGRGLNYSNAFEFALKMMETCYVVAERFSSADLAHGPIAMVEQGFPAFLLTPSGVTWPGVKAMVERLHALKAEMLLVTDASNADARAMERRSIVLPMKLARKSANPEELYTPIPYIVPAQLFVEALAQLKGLDPDKPRTITKVTQTL